MIEVEKKFLLSEADKTRLTEGAKFIGEKVFTDIYYDTPDFRLTLKDQWLRSRERRFELKLPLHNGPERMADQYDEIEEEEKIRTFLDLPAKLTMAEDLAGAGFVPVCICKTTRRKYQKDLFMIDLDNVEFEDFTYSLGEIELMVAQKSEIEMAIEKIMAFANGHDLTIAPVRGKVLEYLKMRRPIHYQALVAAGVVKDH